MLYFDPVNENGVHIGDQGQLNGLFIEARRSTLVPEQMDFQGRLGTGNQSPQVGLQNCPIDAILSKNTAGMVNGLELVAKLEAGSV